MTHFTESDILAADDAERNNTCPFCGGCSTCFRYSPNRCERCGLPVVHWQPWREMQAKIEAITAERDLAVKWIKDDGNGNVFYLEPPRPDILCSLNDQGKAMTDGLQPEYVDEPTCRVCGVDWEEFLKEVQDG